MGDSSIGSGPLSYKEQRKVRLFHPLPFDLSVAKSGIASGLGPEDRRFESYQIDHLVDRTIDLVDSLFLEATLAQMID